MFHFLKFHDRTVRVLGREVLVGVHHQKKFLECLPTLGGFAFDVATLRRTDELYSMIHQGLFLILIFLFLYLENFPAEHWVRRGRVWKYYDYAMQFMFGGLLSGYTIFYFKSASSIPVILFAIALFTLMLLNETATFHKLRFPVRFVLASLCLVSFLVYLIPIIVHWMSWVTFTAAVVLSFAIYYWFVNKIHPNEPWTKLPKRPKVVWGCAIPIVFAILYFFKLIPPVPLSCERLGVYHAIERVGDEYVLSYTRPKWKFWQQGDQTFLMREGDRVNIFTSVFAPTGLQHKIQVRWEKLNARNDWETTDLIPIAIKGGREEGFRGTAYKQNTTPGKWRVRIETEEGRELQRLKFEIINDPDPTSEREIKTTTG